VTVELRTRRREMRRDRANHHEKLGLWEFRVGVNLPSPIWRVWVRIWFVCTPIWGLPNPIRQVVPLISHFCSYPPHCSHLHPPSLSFSSTTLPSSQNTQLSHPFVSLHVMIMIWHRVRHPPSTTYTKYNIHREQHTPSKAYTKYSIHWIQHTPSTTYTEYNIHRVQHTLSTSYTKYSVHLVQHTPSTAYTKYCKHQVEHTPSTAYTECSICRVQHPPKIVCLCFILMIMSWHLNVASGMPTYMIYCHQPSRLESSKVGSPCHISTFASQLTDE